MARAATSRLARLALALAPIVAVGRVAAQLEVPLTSARVVSGLTKPVFVTAPPNDSSRLFVVEQRGDIDLVSLPDFARESTPYLHLPNAMSGGEAGMLGLAFHPNFASNGYFFVCYAHSTSSIDGNGTWTLVRYRANPPYATSTTADVSSRTTILIPWGVGGLHFGGWIGFGTDGFLYCTIGEQGHATTAPLITGPLLGKIVRIDVDGPDAYPDDPSRNYAIPASNPFVGTLGEDEIWHYGLRNPWRASFDRATGDLYIGDVGEGHWEEIDFQPAGRGGLQFGWPCMEANACTPYFPPACACNSPELTLPIHANGHGPDCAVIGGYVYRGVQLCGLQGSYFYADFCGAIRTFRPVNGQATQITDRTSDLVPSGTDFDRTISSMGEDAAGELYFCAYFRGEVYKIVPQPVVTNDCDADATWAACDSQAGTAAESDHVPQECDAAFARYCTGDGIGLACPCGNNGAAGHGCANSVFASGASLTASGVASVGSDSVHLDATGITGALAVFFQGATQTEPTSVDDGIGCVGGPIVRLGNKPASGSSSYPVAGDPPISVRGSIAASGGTYYYQCFYRNAVSAFCPPATSNRTNGVRITWVR